MFQVRGGLPNNDCRLQWPVPLDTRLGAGYHDDHPIACPHATLGLCPRLIPRCVYDSSLDLILPLEHIINLGQIIRLPCNRLGVAVGRVALLQMRFLP